MKKITLGLLLFNLLFTMSGCKGNTSEEVISVTNVSLNEHSITLQVGETFNLKATVLPINATDKTVTWSSSDENIATVNNGLVSALSVGEVTIQVKTNDQNKTDSCKFNVISKITKILSIGNSFGEDTSRYAPSIAESIGYNVLLGHMFIGGCNTSMHLANALSNAKSYRYYKSYKQGWLEKNQVSIEEAVLDEQWDYIYINSLCSPIDFVDDLDELLRYIGVRALNPNVKLGFNFTHSYNSKNVMYHSPTPPEDPGLAWFYQNFKQYDFNHETMFKEVNALAKNWLENSDFGTFLLPMGTAIENAKLIFDEDELHRDAFHLSHFLGRYIAGLTYMFYFSGIKTCSFVPTFLTEEQVEYAIKCVNAAIEHPYEITDVREK